MWGTKRLKNLLKIIKFRNSGNSNPSSVILKFRLLMTALTNIKIWDQEYKNVDSVQYNYAKSEEKEHWELDRPISQFWLYLLTDFVS